MILPIAYFPPVSWFLALLNNNGVIERHENYVKQTIRNRCHIATADGVQRLTVPVVRMAQGFPLVGAPSSDGKRHYPLDFQRKHWHAISTAYGESAFFDYYADDIKEVIFSQEPDLFNYDMASISKVLELFDLDHKLTFTDTFVGEDYTAVSSRLITPPYYQVFRAKTGFLPDLSILDLLFNLGPEAACYLQARDLFYA